MPRKTLALIIGLVVVTGILLFIAIQTGQKQMQTKKTEVQTKVSPTPDVAHTTLVLSPEKIETTSGAVESIDVVLDGSDNEVTAVQLELKYDPKMISNVKVKSAPFFSNPLVLIDKNTPTIGEYTYAYGIAPNQKAIKGKGVVSTITFTARGVAGATSEIVIQPKSLVTAKGVAGSVLKSSTGATVVIAGVKAATTTQKAVTQPAQITLPTR